MKKMELALTRRNGIIVKHISTLEVLERGPYFKPKIMELLETTTPRYIHTLYYKPDYGVYSIMRYVRV